MIKRGSEGFRYGDTNPEHVLAIKRTIQFWNNNTKHKEWIVDENWTERYSPKFIQENKDRNRVYQGHDPDIAFFQWMEDQPVLQLIIEVDGESHDATARKISDGVFKSWIEQHYHYRVPLIRLQKRELVDNKKDMVLVNTYLRQKLQEFIVSKDAR